MPAIATLKMEGSSLTLESNQLSVSVGWFFFFFPEILALWDFVLPPGGETAMSACCLK